MPSLKIVAKSDEPERAREDRPEELRLLEAMLFASSEPLDEKSLAAQLPQGKGCRVGSPHRETERGASLAPSVSFTIGKLPLVRSS